MPSPAPILSLRVTPAERLLLAEAAEQAHTTISDFIRRRAIEAAELQLLDRNVVTIPAESWKKFEACAAQPAKSVPALRKLAGDGF